MRSSPPTRRPANRPLRLAVWLLVAGVGMLVVALSATAGLVVALVVGQGPADPAAVQVGPPSDEVAREVLRQRALMAIREGDYDRAVALTTEAVAVAPGEGDLEELLAIATELRDRKRRVEPAPAVEDPAPGRAVRPPAPTSRPDPPEAPAPTPPSPEPEPALGTAVITSTPKGATFEIAGLVRGTTPYRALDLPAGAHEVVFYVDGRQVHAARIEVPSGGVEIVDVDLATPPAAAPVSAAPKPAPPSFEGVPPDEGPTLIYVFVANSVKPRAIQDAFQGRLGDAAVTAFGSFRELQAAIRSAPPHAVVASRTVLEALGLPVHLQGRDAAGSADERYLLVSSRALTTRELEGAVIGTVDLAGREGSAAFVAKVVGVSAPPEVKRVAEGADLLPLLQFGGADAVVLPEAAARKLVASTQLSLTASEVPAGAGLPAVSVLSQGRRGAVEAAVHGLGADVNGKVGVETWGSP